MAKPCFIFQRGAWGCSVIRSRGADQMPLCQAPAQEQMQASAPNASLPPWSEEDIRRNAPRLPPEGPRSLLHICSRRVCLTSTTRCGCGWVIARSSGSARTSAFLDWWERLELGTGRWRSSSPSRGSLVWRCAAWRMP